MPYLVAPCDLVVSCDLVAQAPRPGRTTRPHHPLSTIPTGGTCSQWYRRKAVTLGSYLWLISALTVTVEAIELSEPFTPENSEPVTLAASLTQFAARQQPGTRLHGLAADLLKAHGINRDRRAAVLKHEDLAKRLVAELGFANAQQWDGYIPPAMVDPGGDERLCASASSAGRGEVRSHLNQLGRYAIGEMPNDSRRRAVLLEISREAWERERQAPAAIAAKAREAITEEDAQ